MRVLIDMNLTPRWTSYLVAAGHTAIHWSEVGSIRAKDGEICDYARDHKYVLLTNDLDFPRILAHTRDAMPSVILMRGEPLVPEARGRALSARSRFVRLRSMPAQSSRSIPRTAHAHAFFLCDKSP
jgi:predicted nuclease of predicted toxin-antitoxin system